MNLLNFKKSVILLLGILLLSIFQPALISASEVNTSNNAPVDEQAKKAFLESKEYPKVKKILKSTEPEYTKPFYDENGQQNGEALVFSAKTSTTNDFDKNKVSGTVTAKVDSPLVAMYNLEDHKVTTVVLFDYSKVNTDKKQIKITDFTNNLTAFVNPKGLNPEVAKASNELNKDVKQTVENAAVQADTSNESNQANTSVKSDEISPKISRTCSVFECTKYKKYGGSADHGCKKTVRDYVCPFVESAIVLAPKVPKAGKVASLWCGTAASLICYVPKGKICVQGRTYYANACPI